MSEIVVKEAGISVNGKVYIEDGINFENEALFIKVTEERESCLFISSTLWSHGRTALEPSIVKYYFRKV